jgi:hypothetical protein
MSLRCRGRRWSWVLTMVAVAAVARAEWADVYLTNGLKLRGDITTTATEVVLRNGAGEVRWPRNSVVHVEPVRAGRPTPTTAPTASSPPATQPTERDELPPAPPISDQDIQRLKLGELTRDGAPESVRVRFLRRGRERELPLEVLDDLRRRPDFRPEWESILLHGQAYEKLQLIVRMTGTAHADRIVIENDPEAFDRFRRRVLPLINRGCSVSGCHAGRSARGFRFPVAAQNSETYAYTTFVLLDQMQSRVGPLIDRTRPEDSVLLQYFLPAEATDRAHPPVRRGPPLKPVLRSRDDAQYEAVRDWIQFLMMPRPDYGLRYEDPYAGPPEAWRVNRSEERAGSAAADDAPAKDD